MNLDEILPLSRLFEEGRDNADTDDDDDGWSDVEEKKAGTDPLNRLSFPLE